MIIQAAKMNAHYKHGPTNIPHPQKCDEAQWQLTTTHSEEKINQIQRTTFS